MRVDYLLFALFVPFLSFAQKDLTGQVRAIVEDAPGNFSSLKGSFKKMSTTGDSLFHSLITISGTVENEIYLSPQIGWLYQATIINPVNEKKGKKIIDEWKDKLLSILDGRFKIEKLEVKPYNPSKYGWKFSAGKLLVALDLYPQQYGSTSYHAILSFIYWKENAFSPVNP